MSAPGSASNKRNKSSEINQIHMNAILAETIKKEMKRFELYTNYKLTPTMKKALVVTQKPNEFTVQSLQSENSGNSSTVQADQEYLDLVNKSHASPREKYAAPVTTSQEMGWETKQLLAENFDARFHHPRVASEITKLYATVLSKP